MRILYYIIIINTYNINTYNIYTYNMNTYKDSLIFYLGVSLDFKATLFFIICQEGNA
jgi:hypothetical protein